MTNELDWNVVTIILLQELMRWCASRKKKKTERTEQTANVGLNFEEEDLVTNIDEDSEDEGENQVEVYI